MLPKRFFVRCYAPSPNLYIYVVQEELESQNVAYQWHQRKEQTYIYIKKAPHRAARSLQKEHTNNPEVISILLALNLYHLFKGCDKPIRRENIKANVNKGILIIVFRTTCPILLTVWIGPNIKISFETYFAYWKTPLWFPRSTVKRHLLCQTFLQKGSKIGRITVALSFPDEKDWA